MRSRAHRAAELAPVPVTVIDAVAGSLPLERASFDAALSCLVLCSVPDVSRALAELHGLLRLGGELRFLEHVHSERSGKARVQSALDRSGLWSWFGGGCHCARDTVAAIRAAGFEIESVTSLDIGPGWAPTNPCVLGLARASDADAGAQAVPVAPMSPSPSS